MVVILAETQNKSRKTEKMIRLFEKFVVYQAVAWYLAAADAQKSGDNDTCEMACERFKNQYEYVKRWGLVDEYRLAVTKRIRERKRKLCNNGHNYL